MLVQYVLSHLEKPGACAQIMLVTSSGFNIIHPALLHNKLYHPSVNSHQAMDFQLLLNQWLYQITCPHYKHWCTSRLCGCTIYTSECTFNSDSVHLLNYADDEVVISLIQQNDETHYHSMIQQRK